MQVTARDVERVREAVGAIARRTPVVSSRALSERTGGQVLLKAENLQRTGSFKVRGAAAKLAALGPDRERGVVCASAGNHGQGVAAAAAACRVPCEVFVPADAPVGKCEAMAAQGATVHRAGESVDACLGVAREHAAAHGMAIVHPFDDPEVVAGQGTLGLELLEDVPGLATVVIPVGGGGLASGVALAVKAARPQVRIVGVRAAESRRTLADGIAIKHPGELTGPLLEELLDDRVEVSEEAIAEAMYLCLERAKLVVEGAGAAGVAAVLGGHVLPAASGATVVVLSGGNVDAGVLASVARRHETAVGRRLVLLTRVADSPGALAGLLDRVARSGGNVVDLSHVRDGVDLNVRETVVELVLETRGPEHAETVLRDLDGAGYQTRLLG